MVEDGSTYMPTVYAILIRTNASLAAQSPTPDFFYSIEDGSMTEGSCTPIPITRRTSGRCTAKIKGGKTLDIRFSTDSLRPADDVQRSYQ